MKRSFCLFGVLALVLVSVCAVYAAENCSWGKAKSTFQYHPEALAKLVYREPDPQGRAGRSNVEHLYLYEKDPITWEIVEDGAWGKIMFNKAKDSFNLAAHGLESNTEYALVHHYDQIWHPGEPEPEKGHILARGYTNEEGNIQLSGWWRWWDMQFWLVLGDDVTGEAGDEVVDTFVVWNPAAYLFEHHTLPSLW